jgi:hypothetical protein
MVLSPIIQRELFQALHREGVRKSRMIFACVGVGMTVLCLLVGNFWFSNLPQSRFPKDAGPAL